MEAVREIGQSRGMSLADLPSALLVPPLNLLAAACVGAVLHRRRAGRVLLAAGLSGLVLLSIPFVSGTLLTSLESGQVTVADAADLPGAIVILSGDLVEVRAAGLDGFTVGHLTLERERTGARLSRATGLPILVTGGRIHIGAPSLAELMTRSLREDFALIPEWQEEHSEDTWQNAALSAAMLRAAGVNSVYLVTHAWHMRRAMIAFRAAGLHAVPAPVDAEPPPPVAWRMLVPRVSAWQESFYALHEWIGCAWYALHA